MASWTRRDLLKAAIAAGASALAWGRAAAQSPSAAALLAAPRRALVIGNSSYGFAPLRNPANDARAIAEELGRIGFEVTSGIDLARRDMEEAIRAHAAGLARGKPVGLFYFAGHGVQFAWRNYLLPVDAQARSMDDVQRSCIDVNALIEGIGKAANPMNMIILDACRENPFGRDFRVEQKGLSQLDAPPGTFLAYATSPGNVASDGEGAHGLYTENLLAEMKVPEAKVEDVFKRVRLRVRRRSNGQQIPWESTSLEEDFYFLPPRELKKLAEEERERLYKEEQALWEKAQAAEAKRRADEERARQAKDEALRLASREAAGTASPIEEYLRQFPSGYFAELAQLQLDRVLAAQGEKKIQVVSSPDNPYSKGSAAADTAFKVGDRYVFQDYDLLTKLPLRRRAMRLTAITDTELLYNQGRVVTDLAGNLLRSPWVRNSANQTVPAEFVVGKRWVSRFEQTFPNGEHYQTQLSFRITGREKITVPAGTFDTFVVEYQGWGRSDWHKPLGQVAGKVWFAPDKVRWEIAREHMVRAESNIRQAVRSELVEYQQN